MSSTATIILTFIPISVFFLALTVFLHETIWSHVSRHCFNTSPYPVTVFSLLQYTVISYLQQGFYCSFLQAFSIFLLLFSIFNYTEVFCVASVLCGAYSFHCRHLRFHCQNVCYNLCNYVAAYISRLPGYCLSLTVSHSSVSALSSRYLCSHYFTIMISSHLSGVPHGT